MNNDYFYTLPPHKPVTGYEYNKNSTLEAIGYFALVNDETILTVPTASQALVQQLIDIDYTDVILEYDLDQVINNKLPTPAIFKSLGVPRNVDHIIDIMWQISGLTPQPLPTLPAGTNYSHVGTFINRPNSGLRLNVSGGGHYVKKFILENGGDSYWFDKFEREQAQYIAIFDFIDGAVKNIRLEIQPGATGNLIAELVNDPWVQQALTHCNKNIEKNYSDNIPKVTISHFKVGANTKDIANNYMKMYVQAEWRG